MKYENIYICSKIFKNAITAPAFSESEIGLMTWREFLKFKNPNEKFHSEKTYDFSLEDLNKEYGNEWRMGPGKRNSFHPSYDASEKFYIQQRSFGYNILNQGKIVAIIHDGIVYYEDPEIKDNIPIMYVSDKFPEEGHDFGVTSYKQVEDLSEIKKLVSKTRELNEAEYPVILQRIKVHGESMTVRAEKQPKLNKGTTIAIINAGGLVVARAQDEWGATLLTVAKEYRGKGLGKIIGQYWYEFNPSYKSGGFTPAGQENALSLWKARVKDFISNGWYTDLIRQDRISKERVKEIVDGLKLF
jgi:GNAT superfamily N-acetyltransferase